MWLETLVYENVNTEYKKVIRPLKAMAVPMDKGDRDMTDNGYNMYYANILGQAIARGLQYKNAQL